MAATDTSDETVRLNPEGAHAMRIKYWISAFILVASAVLLFTHLGHYALWDDEANTALTAQGVLRTGDTTALIGENLVGFRNGWTLHNLKERAQPPLPAYFAAVFMKLAGEDAFGARIGFALCGFLTVALILRWMFQERASLRMWLLMACALLGNVSFFLFCRQSRYYALTILLSAAITYLYLHWRTRRHLLILSLLSIGLLASQYLIFAAVWACLGVDYLLWGRKRQALRMVDSFVLFVPQIVLGAILVAVWNPFNTSVSGHLTGNSLSQRLALFWWNLRDLNSAEFGLPLPFILFAFVQRNRWILRMAVAICVYPLVLSLFSVEPVASNSYAAVRYLVPLIPLCIAAAAIFVSELRIPLWFAMILGILLFETNVVNRLFFPVELRSTLWSYIGELKSPIAEPYTPTADWINQNVPAGKSIWVEPGYMTYPLMFHAPKAIYAWQLDEFATWQKRASTNAATADRFKEFRNLPRIHFKNDIPPDYIVSFTRSGLDERLAAMQAIAGNAQYDRAAIIKVFGKDNYRPELFWRTFTSTTNFAQSEAVFIFKHREMGL